MDTCTHQPTQLKIYIISIYLFYLSGHLYKNICVCNYLYIIYNRYMHTATCTTEKIYIISFYLLYLSENLCNCLHEEHNFNRKRKK